MAAPEQEQAIYDEKVNYILTALKNGKSREEIAEDLNYSSHKSMDMYIRRKNFLWDADRGTYVPKGVDPGFENRKLTGISSKADLIITLFADEDNDPKTVARNVGFNDHRELAEFMERKGYAWSRKSRNYVEKEDEESSDDIADEQEDSHLADVMQEHFEKQLSYIEKLVRYTPMLEHLEKNWEQVQEIIADSAKEQEDIAEIPRYGVPGTTKTKSVYMADRLALIVTEFSKSKNVSQREIFEAAVIDYLRKYGYADAVNSLLSR